MNKGTQIVSEYLKRDDVDVRERLFMLLAGIALIGMLIALVAGIAIHENAPSLIVLGVGFVLFCILVRIGSKKRKIVEVSYVVAAILILIMMPVNFFTSGGIHGGAAIWNVFDAMYIALILRGKPRVFFFSLQAVVVGIMYYVYYRFPEIVLEHMEQTAFQDSLFSFFIVSFVLIVMVSFQTWLYKKENEKTIMQSKEISELNRAQNRFFSSMSHEIRTPINTIIGLNEMILRETTSDDIREDAENIESAGKMLLHLINDILDMSKLESGKMDIISEPFDVAGMISDVVGMIGVRAKEKGLKFVIDISPDIPQRVEGDEVRIKQILINLLNNAVKYTNEGSIDMIVRCDKTDNDDKINMIFDISDTGIGIKKDSIPYLFDAFKRVDEENNKKIEGTGLGLSIVKQFVELMGGSITVDSVYNVGSTFTVEIPLAPSGDELINMERAKGTSVNKGKYTPLFTAPGAEVLVVDDNAMNLKVVERLLKDTEMSIISVSGGEQALEKTLNNSYDIVLMDHEMPGMDGIECFHKIRTQMGGHSKNAKVIALTANAGSENAILYKGEGFDGYVVKPINSRLLENELIRLLPSRLVKINADKLENENIGVLWRDDHKNKSMLAITTDSVAALPKELLKKCNITVIPSKIKTSSGTFNDSIDITADNIAEFLIKNEEVDFENISSERFVAFFSDRLKYANEVIHFSIPEGLVGTNYTQAMEASGTFGSVKVVDTGHFSAGIGLIMADISECAKKGMTSSDIYERIEKIKDSVKDSLITENPGILREKGQLSMHKFNIIRAFSVRPVMHYKNGRLRVEKLIMGSRKMAWSQYIKRCFKSQSDIVDNSLLLVPAVGIKPAEREWIRQEIAKWINFNEVIIYEASSVMAVNCGPGTFGLMYSEKK